MLANLGEIDGGKAGGLASTPSSGLCSISPTFFKRSVGHLLSARIDFGPAHKMPVVRKASAKLGLRFEAKVFKELSALYPGRFAPHLPLSFQEDHTNLYSRPGFAIPDGLLLSSDLKSILCIEIKLRHTTDAWFQLNRFYLPILRRVVNRSMLCLPLEICMHYDPGVKLPEKKRVIDQLEDAFMPGAYPVLLMR